MDKWLKDILPDKDPYHNRGRDQMRKRGVQNLSACGCAWLLIWSEWRWNYFRSWNEQGHQYLH